MGSTKKTWQQQLYGPNKALSLKSRLMVLLRDELGMGRQPKVAKLLVDMIVDVVDATFVGCDLMQPGQVLVLAPEVGQGPSWQHRKLEDKKLKTLRLDLVTTDEVGRLASGEPPAHIRLERLVRLVKQAYEQGATLTSCQLGLLTGTSPQRVSAQLRQYMQTTGEILPTRGIVEDCSPAISHKADIIRLHLEGMSTSEIVHATAHTPRSVERYIRRFEQVRELTRYLDKHPEPAIIARILGCSKKLVKTYLDLMPAAESNTDTNTKEG